MEIKIKITTEYPEGSVEEIESEVMTEFDDAIAWLGSMERHQKKLQEQAENILPEDEDDTLCGKAHNNGELECLECGVIKAGI